MLQRSARLLMTAALATVAPAVSASAQPLHAPSLKELTLAELANLEVTSVSRQAEPVAEAPAAIFVITNDDIRRSGVTTLGEALRLAPNLHVGRTDGTQYGVSARGFNNAVANKLLVLVDGRTIYSPLFSGVFWDQHDVPLEDVERIEVISGPGATLWGTNAVNGVINVITRSAHDTQGPMVSIGGGTLEQVAAFRYGGTVAGHHLRVYGKTSHLESTQTATGTSLEDRRGWLQAGFRADFGSQGTASRFRATPIRENPRIVEASRVSNSAVWSSPASTCSVAARNKSTIDPRCSSRRTTFNSRMRSASCFSRMRISSTSRRSTPSASVDIACCPGPGTATVRTKCNLAS